jgi:S-adenosylmethionine:diacylglycerol 3-amino-3-carboxypropyl transferase
VRDEWVYNSADIDAQRVIFAHDLGAVKDRELLAYYPDRDSWLLTFDPVSGQYKLSPYTENAISN